MSELSSFRISWIGTGVMGLSMCGHLLDKGAHVVVFTRHADEGTAAARARRRLGRIAAAAAEQSDIVFTIVGFPADVREVYLGADGVLAGARRGLRPRGHDDDRAVAGDRDRGAAPPNAARSALDAPVSGGDVGARNATLSIMVGGDAGALERVLPLFEAMGKTIVHQGGPAPDSTRRCATRS